MKRTVLGSVCLLVGVVGAAPLEITVNPAHAGQLPLACVIAQPAAAWLTTFVTDVVAPLLGATQQMRVLTYRADTPHSKSDMAVYTAQGCALALFFVAGGSDRELEWRLYDTLGAVQLKGRHSVRAADSLAEWAVHLVDAIWPELTSQRGSFASLIAACKQAPHNKKRVNNELFVVHPFLSNKQFAPIKLATGYNVAPRWHSHKPLIYFSRHTPFNVRLLSVDGTHCRVVMNADGQNLTPTVSREGRVVLVRSEYEHTRLYEYHFDQATHKSILTCLTRGDGDYFSPWFIDEQRVVFCHINAQSVPQLGILTLANKAIEWLALGAALRPSVSPDGKLIAFCKKVNDRYQVFVYNLATKRVEQLTHDATDKDEVSWSPCGNFIACSIATAQTSRIALVDVQTKNLRFITPKGEHWSCPCWSPYLAVPFAFGH